jgi:hypothetical protein
MRASDPKKIFIYCGFDEKCTVKIQGEQETKTFSDIVEAMGFVRSIPSVNGLTVVALDRSGKVIFEAPL